MRFVDHDQIEVADTEAALVVAGLVDQAHHRRVRAYELAIARVGELPAHVAQQQADQIARVSASEYSWVSGCAAARAFAVAISARSRCTGVSPTECLGNRVTFHRPDRRSGVDE